MRNRPRFIFGATRWFWILLVASSSCGGSKPDVGGSTAETVLSARPTSEADALTHVAGRIETVDGVPLAGVWVALNDLDGNLVVAVESDEGGRFRAARPKQSFALTATSSHGAAAFLSNDQIAAVGQRPILIRLGPIGAALTIHGHVSLVGGQLPVPFLVSFRRASKEKGDIFIAPVSSDGTFSLTAPPGRYFAGSQSPDVVSTATWASGEAGDRVEVDLEMSLRVPAPDDVVAWVGANAIALNTAVPDAPDDDLAPLVSALGGARLIGVGESTHGTAEFFQIKRRLFQRLVKERGVTTLAMEANVADAEIVDAYLQTGRGTVDEAIKHLFLLWRTTEVRDLLAWMRAYNADPKHRKKLRFVGYDVQSASEPRARVLAYLKKVDPNSVALLDPLDSLKPGSGGMVELTSEQKAATRDAAARLVGVFLEKKQSFLTRSKAAEYESALHFARIIGQAQARYAAATPEEGFAERDKGMAENVAWLSERAGSEEPIMIWAHNGHIQHQSDGLLGRNMGTRLREQYGDGYVSIGFMLARGEYRASVDRTRPRETVLVPLDASAPGFLAETFARAGKPIFAMDLRRVPAGTVRDWLSAPHLLHSCGWLVSEEERKGSVGSITRQFDVIIYVGRTTGATRLDLPR